MEGAWLALSVERVTLNLWVLSLSPMLDAEITLKKEKKQMSGIELGSHRINTENKFSSSFFKDELKTCVIVFIQ